MHLLRLRLKKFKPLIIEAIKKHLANPENQIVKGSYRGTLRLAYTIVNPVTKLAVVLDREGNFITGFKLSEGQYAKLLDIGWFS